MASVFGSILLIVAASVLFDVSQSIGTDCDSIKKCVRKEKQLMQACIRAHQRHVNKLTGCEQKELRLELDEMLLEEREMEEGLKCLNRQAQGCPEVPDYDYDPDNYNDFDSQRRRKRSLINRVKRQASGGEGMGSGGQDEYYYDDEDYEIDWTAEENQWMIDCKEYYDNDCMDALYEQQIECDHGEKCYYCTDSQKAEPIGTSVLLRGKTIEEAHEVLETKFDELYESEECKSLFEEEYGSGFGDGDANDEWY